MVSTIGFGIGVLIAVAIYMLPTICAFAMNHGSKLGITILNLFLGWTLIGWLVALVWTFFDPSRPRVVVVDQTKVRMDAEDRADEANGLLMARGLTGKMTFNGQDVCITRHGGKSGLAGERVITLGAISAVQLTAAHLQLIVTGTLESAPGILNTVLDENTVVFNPEQRPAFERLATSIRTAIAERGRGVVVAAASDADELAKLAALRDQGVLTDEEFALQKAKILG